MFKTLGEAFKIKDLRNKILITLGLLIVYRIGCALVCPGFQLGEAISASDSTFFGLMNMLSGDALSNGAILALGVSPYITASIVLQLLTVVIDRLKDLSRQGEDGRRKMALITRIIALVLAIAQSVGIVVAYQGYINYDGIYLDLPNWLISVGIVLILTAGAMFTVWIGEKITKLGIGNGVSLLIFVGIVSSAGNNLGAAISQVGDNIENLWSIIIYLAALVIIFALIVLLDNSERRVKVSYAKQMKGRRMYGGQDSFIPVRLNSSGVMPIILATSLLMLPQLILSFWPNSPAYSWYSKYLGTDSWFYVVGLAILIFLFAFFYSKITFDTENISKRLQQQGGFIPGIRPGKPTAEHLTKISRRITFFSAMFMAVIALIPSLAFKAIGTVGSFGTLINAFSTTGLMIMVAVALEFEKGLSSQMLVRNYKGFLD